VPSFRFCTKANSETVQARGKSNGPRRPSGGVEVWLYSFFNLGAKWCGWSTSRPGRLTPGNPRFPLYRRLGGPQGRSGRVRKISLPSGFDPRTVQPLASRYTDCAIPALTDQRTMTSFLRFLDHTQRLITVSRTPLDE